MAPSVLRLNWPQALLRALHRRPHLPLRLYSPQLSSRRGCFSCDQLSLLQPQCQMLTAPALHQWPVCVLETSNSDPVLV